MSDRQPSNPPSIEFKRQDQLAGFCDTIRRAGRFAFDTEFVMEDRYETEVCLIQLAVDSEVAIIDPFLDLDLGPVWGLVCEQEVETIVHAGQEDLALCVQHTGSVPRNIFDVQVAAGLVGYDYPLSLQKLIQATVKVRLHKGKTLTNWRQRPLTRAQLQYAADDVRYLPAVRRILGERLEKLGRRDWAAEEFAQLERMELYTRASEETLRRVKGARTLKGPGLTVLHDLLAWRDELAQQWNRPPRAVLKDHLAVEIARNELSSYAQIRELRGINFNDAQVRGLCRVVKAALERPKAEWPVPQPREEESPGEAALIAIATAVIRGVCREKQLAYSLVASKNTIRDLLRHRVLGRPASRKKVELLCGWRGGAVGGLVDDVISGRRSVYVDVDGKEPVVRLTQPETPSGT